MYTWRTNERQQAAIARRLRNTQIVDLYKQGHIADDLAKQFGITKMRVSHIIHLAGLSWLDGGAHIRAIQRQDQKSDVKQAKMLPRVGMTFGAYEDLRAFGKAERKTGRRAPLDAFREQRATARQRCIEWQLTIGEWWEIWQTSGMWYKRGRGRGCYVMSRRGDVGPYAVDNVFIQLATENIREGHRRKAALKG